MSESVYLATNEEMSDLVKIGISRDVAVRMDELSRATGVVGKFVCRYSCQPENPKGVETEMHGLFGYCRVKRDREFFRVDWRAAAVALVILTKQTHADRVREIAKVHKNMDTAGGVNNLSATGIAPSATDIQKRRDNYMGFIRNQDHFTNPDRKAKKYDGHLQKLAGELRISTVYSITSVAEAEAIHRRLGRGQDLSAANQAYKNGGMGAAMGWYVKFLRDNPQEGV